MEDMILPEGFEIPSEPTETAEAIEDTTIDGADAESDATEGHDETESTDGYEEESTEQAFEPYTVLKYNHQELPITSKEEADRLAQIGYHYQNKLEGEFNRLKGIEQPYEKLNELANMYGMGVTEVLEALETRYFEQQAEDQGVDVGTIRREAELNRKEAALKQQEEAKQTESQKNTMYARFFEAYPNADVNAIKPETWDQVNSGMDLTTAYTMQVNKELQSKFKQTEKAESNRKKAPVGSVTTYGGQEPAKEQDDPFLAGFKS